MTGEGRTTSTAKEAGTNGTRARGCLSLSLVHLCGCTIGEGFQLVLKKKKKTNFFVQDVVSAVELRTG